MGAKTDIEWADSTVNPTTGCDGCELWNGRDVRACYAGGLHERRFAKTLPVLYAENFQEVRLAPGRMAQAARWPDLRGKERPGKPWLNGFPRMIFVGDMGDFMSREVPDEYVENEIVGAIRSPEGSRHFWLLLTKQIRRLADLSVKIGGLPDNCMAMTTVTSQPFADTRVADLLQVKCRWRGVSAEPLWGPIEFDPLWIGWRRIGFDHKAGKILIAHRSFADRFNVTGTPAPQIDWVIVGGESGPSARPMHPEWVRSLRDQCQAARLPVFFKQWGEWIGGRFDCRKSKMVCQAIEPGKEYGRIFWTNPGEPKVHLWDEADHYWTHASARIGKARAGRLLDGREWNEFPEVSR